VDAYGRVTTRCWCDGARTIGAWTICA